MSDRTTRINDGSPAIDAREQLRRWDAGESIWTIDMGGMGPGYEQAIQVLAIEIVRDNLNKPLPEVTSAAGKTWGYDTVERIDHKLPNGKYACGGFSGAQVGAARFLAWQWLKVGPAALLKSPQLKKRRIQASNFWPHVQPQIGQLSDDQLTRIVKSVFEDAGFQPNEHPECLLAIIVARRVRDMARSGNSEVSQ
jgi:hypothetical protein